jgi:hypothetical protein
MKRLSLTTLLLSSLLAVGCSDGSTAITAPAESSPLYAKEKSTTSTATFNLGSGVVPNPCGGGSISYSGSVGITGTITVQGKTATITGSVNTLSLVINGDGVPGPIPFTATAAKSGTTYTVPVSITVSGSNVTVTLTITMLGNGQITGVAVTGITCQQA